MKKNHRPKCRQTRTRKQTPRKTPPEPSVLMIPNAPCLDEIKDFVREADRVLTLRPARLILRFVGGSWMKPDAALAIHALLARRPAGVQVHADALSSVVGPAVILFLEADTREIRPSAFLYLPSPERDPAEAGIASQLLQDADAWKSEEAGSVLGGFRAISRLEMERVRQIANQHVSVAELMESPMDAGALTEYGLLGDGPWEQLLASTVGKPCANGESSGAPDPAWGRRGRPGGEPE